MKAFIFVCGLRGKCFFVPFNFSVALPQVSTGKYLRAVILPVPYPVLIIHCSAAGVKLFRVWDSLAALNLLQRQSSSEVLIDYIRSADYRTWSHIHTTSSSSSLLQMFIDKLRLQSGAQGAAGVAPQRRLLPVGDMTEWPRPPKTSAPLWTWQRFVGRLSGLGS